MKNKITFICLIFFLIGSTLAQNFNSQVLFDNYPNYRDGGFNNKRFKYEEVAQKIKELEQSKIFNIKIAGSSLEGREIFLVSAGNGKTNILIWSQMHGDEPTATMALFDVFKFLESNDEFNELRKFILENLSLTFIPMLNPDGAERFTRRNALYIDINRDAKRLEFPESKILKSVRDSLKPKFAFNLHDQSTRYSTGDSYRSATISFLAPAYNYEKSVNNVRSQTMKLIVNLYKELSKYIPGHIARYKDDFEPRAFGDNFMKWGTGSVLIESGGWKNDNEKQFIRKLNFIALISGLYSIASNNYSKFNIEEYNKIPFNDNLLFDLLLRNLKYNFNGKNYLIDVGINREEFLSEFTNQTYFVSKIVDWGDLSIFYGLEEYDLAGYEIKQPKIYELTDKENLSSLSFYDLLKDGFGFVKINNKIEDNFCRFPINIVANKNELDVEVKYQNFANFTLWKNKELRYNIINGYLFDVNSSKNDIKNGIIFK